MNKHIDSNEQDEKREERKETFTRRRLLQVGWTVPVIVALEMAQPKTVFASGGGSHIDFTDHRDSVFYVDRAFWDFHTDYYVNHGDSHDDGHSDLHKDGPYWDIFSSQGQSEAPPENAHEDFHSDSHEDGPEHEDTHGDSHEDRPRTDVTSHEDYLDHIDS